MTKIQQTLTPRHSQELALKPKMLQSLQMLSIPQIEMEMQIKRELEMNPILELQEEVEELQREEHLSAEEEGDLKSEEEEAGEVDENLLKKSIDEIKEFSDILDEWSEYHKETREDFKSREGLDSYTNQKAEQSNLKDFFGALENLKLRDDELEYARELVENIDEFGFLPPDFEIYQLAAVYISGNDEETLRARADEIHLMIMKLEPRGITARSIQECLLSQLDENDNEFDTISRMLKDHFEDLIHRRYVKITENMSITHERFNSCRNKISKLNPKPGLQLFTEAANYITPDVIVKRIEGEFDIYVNDFNIPHLVMNRYYKNMIISGKVKDKEILDFVREKINSAKFLIKSLYMRNKTILRVTKSIIEHQRDFFYEQSGALKPLTYSVIAEDVGVSESTISRVVKDKFMDTPLGLLSMKSLFTASAGKNENYEDVSRQIVQKYIQKFIEMEDKQEPVSDSQIVEKLRKMNINVSRRVIAKYRESLGLLNSRLRRSQE